MSFDELIDRRGTHCNKWDDMEKYFGIAPEDGLAMWVADMDFRPPPCVSAALQRMVDHGIYGYYGDDREYRQSIRWWLAERHGWQIEPDWIFSTNGLVNGAAICVDSFTAPGDGVVLFSPVYHAFYRVLKASGREIVECELAIRDGRYVPDFGAWDAQMTGREKLMILCSPHNPGGRVWSRDELQGFADFARRHDLVLVSDEIHHDLAFPGHRHIPMPLVDPSITDRLVMMSAVTKSFNVAGAHVGNVIIEDAGLRARFAQRMLASGTSANAFGQIVATAAYCPEGAAWIDDLMVYLDGNRRLFDAAISEIPGLRSMPLEGTYLAWVDFTDTGMEPAEFTRRVEAEARIATSHGANFGKGGERFLRFNFATPRARVEEAITRLQAAFADLQ